MDAETIEGLMSAYGFSEEFHDDEQSKTRYRSEDTFLDLWQGKKGTTVGVYNRQTKAMWFERPFDLEDLEHVLMKATK